MKFTKIENGIYKAENGMFIKRDIPHNMFTGKEMPHETRWYIFWRGSKIAFGITLREAKEWIEEHEAETHMLETAPETEEKGMNQPEPERATESITEPQSMAQDAFTRLVKIDKNGTKVYADWRCPRCGGAGGANSWKFTGFTCWGCGGTGRRSKPAIYKEYTPEHQAKLDAQRIKRAEKRLEERREKAQELNSDFFQRNGFNADGNMWIVLGNSYDIKDELKALGCKFSSPLSCWCCDHELEGYDTIMLNASEMYEADDAGCYLWRWMKVNEVREIIRTANEELKSSKSSSSYVGKIGDRIEVRATFTNCHTYETTLNFHVITHFINVFTDEAGNVYVWNTTAFFEAGVGDQIILKGTIKGHSEYKGIKQTELQRCKITKEVA